ncbi:dTDP-4-dehydrorhamnose reductase [Paraflavisolibacter sp. H34]|uniref:dTDP-4-dehydrorhamnose reductase n=1 Tax=Huijunlia imazamoxiresistens TaxID=3127457 RepID=UPI003015AA78
MSKIVIIGANGQLGSEFQELAAANPGHEFFFFDRDLLDITVKEDVERKIAELQPDYLVNCAAYTAVDKAETDVEAAFAINGTAVGHLAAACAAHNVRLVHISTDYVFDGTASAPYTEDAPVAPANVYGRSKLQGEQEAQAHDPQAIIIRTAWVYSVYGNNFVKTMLRLMKSRPELNVVADQQGSPTYAADLAQAILHIVETGNWVPGIYHFTNEGVITWFDFAEAIRSYSHAACTVHPIPTEQYPTPASRPKYSVLDKTKFARTFGIELKPWQESLRLCLEKLAVAQ